MVDHVFRLHGLPQFASRFWKEFCRQIGASASLSSGFHPQTNGQCERANQDLERMLRCLTSNNPSSWCQQLSWIEYARNSLPVAASGMSPFECSVGYKPPLFPSQEPDAAVPSALAFVQRCRRTWERVREILLRTAGRTKAAADRRRSSPPTYVSGLITCSCCLCVVMSCPGFVLTARHMCLSTLLFPRPPCFSAR